MPSQDNDQKEKRRFEEVDLMEIVAVPQDPLTPVSDENLNPIVFWCKDCREFVEVEKHPTKIEFKCKQCKGTNVPYGTKRSMENFYGDRR